MFRLTDQPIDADALRRAMLDPGRGALVEFSGIVRNQNLGRDVVALEYEGAAPLATAEFTRIEEEARGSFAVARIDCVHRTGRLAPGETAVWIGVTAVHRDAAFSACQFVLNQLKLRLPIWKKEFHRDGDSGWINAP